MRNRNMTGGKCISTVVERGEVLWNDLIHMLKGEWDAA
jgi:hypothetical protein